MKREIAQLWIQALRSGEFKQAQRALRAPQDVEHSTESYCCLGVLCELFRRETGKGEWAGYQGNFFTLSDAPGDRSLSFLPRTVGEWLGLEGEELSQGDPYLSGGEQTASELNDRLGYSFEDIADAIEWALEAQDRDEAQEREEELDKIVALEREEALAD